MNLKQAVKSRRFRQGSFAAALTALFIAIVVALNMVVSVLSARYPLRVDLTSEQAFVLTDQSKEFVKNLTRGVNIYILTREDALKAAGDYYIQASEIIKQYAAASGHITVEYVDLARRPDFARRFSEHQLDSSTIILESDRRVNTISFYDLFNIESDFFESAYYQSQYIASSKAEQVMTNAIMRIVMEKPPTISILHGFGEGGTRGLAELLEQNLYVTEEQNLLTEDIHPDASLLIISAPMRDYSENELRKLDDFLLNGGNYGRAILYFADVGQPDTPNLDAFLADWGIAVDDGIIFQTDQSRLVANSFYWSVVAYGEEFFSRIPIARQLFTVMPEARPMRALWEENGMRQASPILYFDEGVRVQPLDDDDEDWSPDQSDIRGPIPAMILARETGYPGGEEAHSFVVAAASSLMMEPWVLENPYFGNAEYLLAVIEELSGKESGPSIAPKTIGGSLIMISELHIIYIGAIFVVILPVFILVTGGVVFFRRRHL